MNIKEHVFSSLTKDFGKAPKWTSAQLGRTFRQSNFQLFVKLFGCHTANSCLSTSLYTIATDVTPTRGLIIICEPLKHVENCWNMLLILQHSPNRVHVFWASVHLRFIVLHLRAKVGLCGLLAHLARQLNGWRFTLYFWTSKTLTVHLTWSFPDHYIFDTCVQVFVHMKIYEVIIFPTSRAECHPFKATEMTRRWCWLLFAQALDLNWEIETPQVGHRSASASMSGLFPNLAFRPAKGKPNAQKKLKTLKVEKSQALIISRASFYHFLILYIYIYTFEYIIRYIYIYCCDRCVHVYCQLLMIVDNNWNKLVATDND